MQNFIVKIQKKNVIGQRPTIKNQIFRIPVGAGPNTLCTFMDMNGPRNACTSGRIQNIETEGLMLF